MNAIKNNSVRISLGNQKSQSIEGSTNRNFKKVNLALDACETNVANKIGALKENIEEQNKAIKKTIQENKDEGDKKNQELRRDTKKEVSCN